MTMPNKALQGTAEAIAELKALPAFFPCHRLFPRDKFAAIVPSPAVG